MCTKGALFCQNYPTRARGARGGAGPSHEELSLEYPRDLVITENFTVEIHYLELKGNEESLR